VTELTTTSSGAPEWSDAPVQTRNERFASVHPDDFPAISARQQEWRLSPIAALAALADGELDGGRYDVTVTGAEHNWVPLASIAGDAGLPEDRVSARAWSTTVDALHVVVSGEGDPVVIRRSLSGVRAAHLVIEFTANNHRTVILHNAGDVALAENVEIIAHDGSHGRLIHLGEWDSTAIHAASHFVRIDKDAQVDHVLVSLGGAVQRVNPAFILAGVGARVESFGLYFADRGQHIEHQVFVNHKAAQTRSNVLYKGALHGKGTRTVWVGDVLIGPDATGTDSYEANRNLVLSDGARADSIPNLEIETGDIAGAGHASATGRLDDEHLFYLQARGITETEARRLVAHGLDGELRVGGQRCRVRARTRTRACPWIWHTRDSETSSTCPISRRLSSSS
jgi:Fe-S cluster assembly protein SufD